MERIFLAFSLSVVGSLITKQLGGLWWVGGLIGFALGYIGYDVRGFIRAIPVAFSKACAKPKPSLPTKEYLASACRHIFYSAGAGISTSVTMVMIADTIANSISAVTFIIAAILSIAFTLVFVFGHRPDNSYPELHKTYLGVLSCIVLWIHPIPFVLRTLPIGIFYALRGVAWATEKGSELICRFIYHLIRLVHSHDRVLFGIDVAIGSLVGGHYLDNAIVGGLAGMVWWIFDHHLISVKLLKLEPVAR